MKVFFFVIGMVHFFVANGQDERSLEFSSTIRYDRHGEYLSNYAGRAYNDTTRLYGMSYGASIQYRHEVFKELSVYLGLGVYRLGVDKVRGNLPFGIPGTRTARNINYDDGMTNLLYSTDKYHYNNLALTLGFTKSFPIQNKLKFDISAEAVGYYSYSQRYDLNDGYRTYRASNPKKLEFGANLLLGVVKEFERFYLRPALLVPVFQNLRGDKVFYEEENLSISKWFQGIGLVVRVGREFSAKK